MVDLLKLFPEEMPHPGLNSDVLSLSEQTLARESSGSDPRCCSPRAQGQPGHEQPQWQSVQISPPGPVALQEGRRKATAFIKWGCADTPNSPGKCTDPKLLTVQWAIILFLSEPFKDQCDPLATSSLQPDLLQLSLSRGRRISVCSISEILIELQQHTGLS